MRSLLKQKTVMLLALAALIVSLPLVTPWASAVKADPSTAVHVTRFDLISHGLTIGHGRITRTPTLRNGNACMELRLVINSKVNLPFYKFAMQMEESWITDTNGLMAYTFDSVENGRSKTITGKLQDGVFHFETIEAGQTSVWTTLRTAYDFASNSHPEPALTNGEAKIFTVLDPATCTITQRTYRGTGTTMLSVGNRRIMCNTITIECPGTHLRRWVIADEFGPLILREDGDQHGGTYSRRAISMDPEGNIAE